MDLTSGRTLTRRAGALLLALGLAGAAQPLGAQGAPRQPTAFEGYAPDAPSVPIARGGFALFANADFAVAGLRMTGTMGFNVNNNGPISNWTAYTGSGVSGSVVAAGAFRQQYIGGINFIAGVPISDFRRIREVHPGVSGMRAPVGYSVLLYQGLLQGFPQKWGPADLSVGRLFSGNAVTTTNKSCTDFTGALNGDLLPSLTLLAVSDCPQTWASTGFDGPRVITDSAFLYLRDSVAGQGRAGFRFDFAKIPPARRGALIGTVSTYGETSDHPSEILTSYGSVTPLASGAPQIPGFPLGLDIRWEAFQISRPQLSNIVFYNMIVVNNSERVYGRGIDFDSLYMGITHGFLAGADQNSTIYHLPNLNAVVATGGNASRNNCNGARQPAGVTVCGGNGQQFGTTGIVMLKSPIGDERNKLLTTNGSAFFDPASPFADDTITFNHARLCGIGCFNQTYGTSGNERRGFGALSSTASNFIDGRDLSAVPSGDLWAVMRNRNYNGISEVAAADFNKFVPGATLQPGGQPYGSWDWDGKPGQDTLFYDTCALNGCVAAWSDTMPGGQVNRSGNVGGTMVAGPFQLGAGDTTSFVLAFIGAAEMTQLMIVLDNARQAYKEFFAGPQPFPAPAIAQVSVLSAEVRNVTGNDPQVELRIAELAERFTDPYLAAFATSLESSADPYFVNLRRLNPALSDSIRGRSLAPGTPFPSVSKPGTTLTASGNLAGLYIYRSCDGGGTFDATGDCVGDPLVTAAGGALGLGWRPYATLDRDATGDVANLYTDVNVIGGRTYLYSVVTRTRGLSLPVVQADPTDATAACVADVTACRRIGSMLTISDTLLSPLARSGPSTASVYVPISLPAGGAGATAVARATVTNSTLPVTVTVGAQPRAGTYRVVFGNRARVEERLVAGAVIATTVVLEDTVAQARVGGRDTSNVVRSSETFTSDTRVAYVSRDTTFTAGGTSGDTTIRVDTLRAALIGALVEGAGAGSRLLSISTTPTVSLTPPEIFGRPDFPGFVLAYTLADTATAVRSRVIQPNGDSVQTGILNNSMAQLQFSNASPTTGPTLRRSGSGTYTLLFDDDVFGPRAPFRLADAEQIERDIVASLAARAPTTMTVASPRISELILRQVALPNAPRRADGSLALVEAPLPFRLRRRQGRGPETTSLLAFVRRDSLVAAPTALTNTILVGSGPDTARVTVPATTWVPGDQLFVLDVIQRDSTVGSRVVFDGGVPITVTDTVVAFGPLVLGCTTPRLSCNPLALGTPGATTYLPYQDGWQHVFEFPVAPTLATEFTIDVTGPRVADRRLTGADLSKIRVVPNPYIVQSQYDVITTNQALNVRNAEPRIIFAGVPEQGSMRIYTVSGALVQSLTWTRGDLASVNNAGGTGDLPYNLRTREGTDIASGLYLYVITAGGPNGGGAQARGKFVVIR